MAKIHDLNGLTHAEAISKIESITGRSIDPEVASALKSALGGEKRFANIEPSDAFAELMKDLDHICAHGDRGSQETAHDARDRLRAILTTPAAVATAATPSAASVPIPWKSEQATHIVHSLSKTFRDSQD